MSNKTKTIAEIITNLKAKGVKQSSGSVGKPLQRESYSPTQVSSLLVDRKYQRLISPNKITSYGIFNWSLCIPVVVSRRPQSLSSIHTGEYIIDGQNKVVKHVLSKVKEPLPVVVLEHDEDTNYKQVLEAEAELFHQLNTWVKKLDTIDNLRALVCIKDKLAKHVESTLNTLNLQCTPNTFGSEEDDAFPLKAFTHFYYCVKDDFTHDGEGIEQIQTAYRFWRKIYINTIHELERTKRPGEVIPAIAEHVNGSTFRAIAHLDQFITHGLSNGKQERFREWCIWNIAKNWKQDKLVKGFNGFQLPRWTLDRIIDKYNDEESTRGKGAQTLGPVTLYEAGLVDEKFKSHDEDKWKNIVRQATSPV